MKKDVDHTPVGYPPGKPGIALLRQKQKKIPGVMKPISRQRKPLNYNDQLPLPGFD